MKIKYRNVKKYLEEKTMSMNKEELYELRDALETVQKWDNKLNTKILHKKRTEKLFQMIKNSLREKEKADLADRLDRLEQTVSKIANKK